MPGGTVTPSGERAVGRASGRGGLAAADESAGQLAGRLAAGVDLGAVLERVRVAVGPLQESSTPGLYSSTAWIPPNLLNEGTTSIDVALCTLWAPKLHQRAGWYDAVSFYVVDPGDGDSARGRFMGQLRGVVRPLLDWTTERLD